MHDSMIITYCFNFDDGKDKTYSLQLDRDTLDFSNSEVSDAPEWTKLSEYCPVALNLNSLTENFNTKVSHESIYVEVTTEDRTYKKRTTIEEALSSVMGIIMVTSVVPYWTICALWRVFRCLLQHLWKQLSIIKHVHIGTIFTQ